MNSDRRIRLTALGVIICIPPAMQHPLSFPMMLQMFLGLAMIVLAALTPSEKK